MFIVSQTTSGRSAMNGQYLTARSAIGEVMNRFTGLVVILGLFILSPGSAPAGVITTQPGTFISAETDNNYSNKFGFSGGNTNGDRPGAEVFTGGSGAGSEFLANGSDLLHHEVTSAGVYQNWGIFGGAAPVAIRLSAA